MTDKYTPGPWGFHDTEKHTIVKKKVGTIASSNSLHFSEEENEANAQLIAAAPEMLEFLEQMVDISGKYPYLNGQQIVADAYKLINKATNQGESK